MLPEAKEIMKEVGDVLWYVAMTRQELQLPPVEFPKELHKLDDTDVYRLSPSYLLQQAGIINGQVKKYFRDDDYSKPFPEKEKRILSYSVGTDSYRVTRILLPISREEK